MPLYAYTEPRQFMPASRGTVSLNIENLHATADIYLHTEYEKPLGGWIIPAGLGIPVFEWRGGLLWISASVNNVPYQVMEIQPARGQEQARRGGTSPSQGGGSGGSGGSGDGAPSGDGGGPYGGSGFTKFPPP